MAEHRGDGHRIDLIGIRAEQLVIEKRGRVEHAIPVEAKRRNALDVRPVAQLVIDTPVGDGVAHTLTVFAVIDETIEHRADGQRRFGARLHVERAGESDSAAIDLVPARIQFVQPQSRRVDHLDILVATRRFRSARGHDDAHRPLSNRRPVVTL